MPRPPRDLTAIRRDYGLQRLDEALADPDPLVQFDLWFADAVATGVPDPNAMTASTAGADGVVSARTVLLKGADARGFVFATNYRSRKGAEVAANPHAALTFYWRELERQVCVDGAARRTTRAESDAIFAARPREAQLAAWASEQSAVLSDRAQLEARVAEVTARYADVDLVPRPAHWGGIRVVPATVEFWQGGSARLHDRLRYRRVGRSWRLERLSP
ncbi:MAG TPA: pyridoxamine 5'-phosphate oxidase [Mycobacteriales bacterium]|nr:pyridoxamine 5'-phosphate oxidase [Mycobacteriales bacterium]